MTPSTDSGFRELVTRSQKTAKSDIQLATGRYADLLKWRKEHIYDTHDGDQGQRDRVSRCRILRRKVRRTCSKKQPASGTARNPQGGSWKQVEATAQLHIDQAKVSKLLAGQMAGFSIERLVHFLSLLGQDVEVTVRKAPGGRRRGTMLSRTAGASRKMPV